MADRPIMFGGVVMNNAAPVYLDPPTIPEGQTVAEYRHGRGRRRSRWQRLVRRLNGHG